MGHAMPISERTRDSRQCIVDGCLRKPVGRRCCGMHYQRFKKYGDWPNGAVLQSPLGEPMKFIVETVENPPEECVNWTFCMSGTGYGQVSEDGKMIGAHVMSLRMFTGEDANGRCALHEPKICHNKACINPKHLRWGTHKENQSDKKIDGTNRSGEKSHTSKLKVQQVLKIIKDPRSRVAVAKDYGVTPECISAIMLGKNWAQVTGIKEKT